MAALSRNADDLLDQRGGAIDPLRVPEQGFDADSRIDQAIAESFPASDPPSWTSGIDEAPGHAEAIQRPRRGGS